MPGNGDNDDVIARIILRLRSVRQWEVAVKDKDEILNVRDFNLAIRALEVTKARYLREARLRIRLRKRKDARDESAT